jgi:hypothetical protein
MKKLLLVLLIVFIALQFSFAQETDSSTQQQSWIVHAEVSSFFIPGDFYLNPVAWVKKNHLHLEARYNYEDFETVSFFGGYNFSLGNKLHLDATPMAGFSLGNTTALLPAAEFELTYWNVGLYGEMEYAIVLNESESNFFSYWGELYYSPWEWMWFGIAAQRIRLNETGLDVQRGPMLALQRKWITVTGYYFNPFTADDFWMVNVGLTFE